MTAGPTLTTRDRGIILAADVPSLDGLASLARVGAQVPEVVAVKVGFSLGLRFGLHAVADTVRNVSSLPVIYDHQKAATDIPAMGRPFAETCREAGVRGVILFPQAGPKTLEAFVSAALDHELVPIVGLVMTHPGYLESDGGFITDRAPGAICEAATELGVRAFVLPGNKPDAVAAFSKGTLMGVSPAEVMMPGIGAQGGTISEAFEAAKPHHPFAIIGSAVYRAADPLEALKGFAAEVRT